MQIIYADIFKWLSVISLFAGIILIMAACDYDDDQKTFGRISKILCIDFVVFLLSLCFYVSLIN